MKYQLVLQWPASSIADYDGLIEMEDALRGRLSGSHLVDGHDLGSGEMNIFIHADNPKGAFEEAKKILCNRHSWPLARAAYRDVAGEDYTILWPDGLTQFRVT